MSIVLSAVQANVNLPTLQDQFERVQKLLECDPAQNEINLNRHKFSDLQVLQECVTKAASYLFAGNRAFFIMSVDIYTQSMINQVHRLKPRLIARALGDNTVLGHLHKLKKEGEQKKKQITSLLDKFA